jgi:hypothetical protein
MAIYAEDVGGTLAEYNELWTKNIAPGIAKVSLVVSHFGSLLIPSIPGLRDVHCRAGKFIPARFPLLPNNVQKAQTPKPTTIPTVDLIRRRIEELTAAVDGA